MDVILLERVEKLGQMGQVVKVKPGFARNFLLPQKKALRATKENLAYFETQKARLEARNLELRKEAEQVAGSMGNVSVVITRQSGETGQLYGSVSSRDIADALAEKQIQVERRQVAIDQPIKTLGLFPVRIVLHPEVFVTITVNVARSADEAELQAQRGGMVTGLREEDEEEEVEETATEEGGEETAA
ncbi:MULTISPECIES: 50S ribosomal protein L9 [Rhodospirillales]|uniref:Large ribosomal subunit protein bL9 n=2 Tax=Rhodospirillales TaxID=204441 RepID=RL9_RHOCS|nr:50S ribosomal protein L9 [Rhodospirillum centenum]B6IN81.1 RecName: Full=Large ribosomal subunit protein bL9; AltName: Full=50S ribosomal protein L9 [Rhodospirillum centenum SW]ACI98978.1 ribosomal protein L9 [Rhodospirillum centenum SW]